MNQEKISLCGDNCSECPRYKAKTEEELKNLRSTLLNLKSKLSNLSNNYYK